LMNKYYEKTDDVAVYRLSMVLHPGLKFQYFAAHGWEQEWIDAARDLTREMFEKFY
ncbi:hypothetical protein C8J57DRAFT_1035634, partial [Mycena rebaudengoi]